MSAYKYVVLLRGVNVGGNRRVPKAEFQQVLESLGCSDVAIYINSGNAVFSSPYSLQTADVQKALELHFGFTVPTLLLTAETAGNIAFQIPKTWTNDSLAPNKIGHKSDVIYLFDDINYPGILQDIGYNPDIETMIYVDGAILTNITRANQMKGSLQKLIGTKLYTKMTIRNINTARKLAELTDYS